MPEEDFRPLAESIARQSKELWSHLPAELVPDEDATIQIKTDDAGNLQVKTPERGYYLWEGQAWSWRWPSSDSPDVRGTLIIAYRNGREVSRGTVKQGRNGLTICPPAELN